MFNEMFHTLRAA